MNWEGMKKKRVWETQSDMFKNIIYLYDNGLL